MTIDFKWKVGDVIKMPSFTEDLVKIRIVERRYIENKEGAVIEYETDMFMHMSFTQTEIEEYN